MEDERVAGFTDKQRESLGLVDENGFTTERGQWVISELIERCKDGRLGHAFGPVKKVAGGRPVVPECILINGGRVLMHWREHDIFGNAWYVSGSYPKDNPYDQTLSETLEDALRRSAREDYGVEIDPVRQIITLSHHVHPRFPDAGILWICKLVNGDPRNLITHDNPKSGDTCWFSECPPNMVQIQKDYAPYINDAIQTSGL
jgi:ADP-ribose pyrophosphatase YjhB (NUDIX family)